MERTAAVRGRSRRRPPRKSFLDVVKSLWSRFRGIVFWIIVLLILFNIIPIALWLLKSFFKAIIWFFSLPVAAAIVIVALVGFLMLAAYIWF